MSFLNRLRMMNNSCIIEIRNGEYIDTSNAGMLGLISKSQVARLNNGIIAGISCSGRAHLIDTILYDATNSGKPVVYVCNRTGKRPLSRYGTEVESGALGSQAVIVDINKQVDGINLFKGMPLSRLTDTLIDIMASYIPVDDSMRDFCTTWYNKIYEVLKLTIPKEKFSLSKIRQYTFDWMSDKYKSLHQIGRISWAEYFAMDHELQEICIVYQAQMMKFMNFSRIIGTNGLAKLLSGKINIGEIYNKKMVLLVNLCEGARTKESAIFLRLLLQRLAIEEATNASGTVCMFEDCNIKGNATYFLELLRTGQANENEGSIYFTERSITWWRENLSRLNEHPISYCNAFFIFRQNITDDLKIWSALSGSTKKEEVSYNSAPMASVYPLAPSSWTNILLNCCMVYTGSSSKEIDAYRVEEQEIDNLDDKSCITIIKMEKNIYNRKVTWN